MNLQVANELTIAFPVVLPHNRSNRTGQFCLRGTQGQISRNANVETEAECDTSSGFVLKASTNAATGIFMPGLAFGRKQGNMIPI